MTEILSNVSNNFHKHRLNSNNTFRNKVFPRIKSIKNNNRNNRNKIDLDILSAASSTKRFVSHNPNVVFTRADKGNTVVALDRIDYINKMENNLADTSTYISIQRNPINKIIEYLKKILKCWLQNEYIIEHTHTQLNSSNAILLRAYDLPKIHKTDYPLRIIVSSIHYSISQPFY